MTIRHWTSLCFVPAAAMVAPTMIAPAFAQDYLTAEQAQRTLFPKADAFAMTPLQLTDEQRTRIKVLSGMRQRRDTQSVWAARKEGQLLGWFVVDEVVGKHEFITYAAALSPEGHVLGVEILNYRETHGGQIRNAAWRSHFVGKSLADAFKLDKDIPNISGATLSCRNVTDGVKRLLALQRVALPRA